jgi:hypothetical protein
MPTLSELEIVLIAIVFALTVALAVQTRRSLRLDAALTLARARLAHNDQVLIDRRQVRTKRRARRTEDMRARLAALEAEGQAKTPEAERLRRRLIGR